MRLLFLVGLSGCLMMKTLLMTKAIVKETHYLQEGGFLGKGGGVHGGRETRGRLQVADICELIPVDI